MKFGIMILDGPDQHQAADTAYHFIQAARARGHEIIGVFLFADGVDNVNRHINPPGERNIAARFDELGKAGVEVVACTACAKFRGLRPDIKVDNVKLSGLGALAGFLQQAERFVTFSD
jgi:tRNA 2-thiouridine synthesizing protein D